MNYYLVEYEIRSGEHECSHVTTIESEADARDAIDAYFSDFYGEDTQREGWGRYVRSDLCEAAKITGWKTLTKENFDILRRHNI